MLKLNVLKIMLSSVTTLVQKVAWKTKAHVNDKMTLKHLNG